MTGTDKKIIINGKAMFLFILLVLVAIIPISFAERGINNAKHNLTEILHDNLSVDFNRNDWVDQVDYTHKMDFLGVIGDLTCQNGMMVGIDKNGPICLNLEEFFNEFNENDKKCFSKTTSCGGTCVLDCTPDKDKGKPKNANSENYEMVFGSQKGGCPSKAYIVCCEAVKPKKYDENFTQTGDCVDTDRDEGDPEEQVFTKGSVTLTKTNITKEDICVNEHRIEEFYCKDTRMENIILTCQNGCHDGTCLK